MVEDVRLDGFVLRPRHRIGEAVDFQRQAVRSRAQLAHHQRHVLVHAGVGAQIALDIGAEGPEIGHPAGVDRVLPTLGELGVPLVDLLALVDQVILQQAKAIQPLALVGIEKMHALLIQIQAALDAPAAAFLHAAPVLERIRDKALCRDAGDGLVPVLHLDGMQRDIDHVAVGIELRHLHPVADADQVVGGDLYAGHQRKQGVLEDQHQHRRHCTEAGEQDQRRTVDQSGDDEDGGDRVDDDLHHLQIALDRVQAGVRSALVDHVDDVEHRAERQRDGQHDEAAADVLHHGHRGFRQARYGRHAKRQHQCRDDVRQPFDDAEILQFAIAGVAQ